MNTEIAQNGEEIQARVSKQEFNASQNVISSYCRNIKEQLRE